MKFKDLPLSETTLKAIEKMGFEKPTAIQEKIIPLLLETNKDVTGLAQTGTGKTAAFGLPIIEKINTKSRKIQSVILCPTRELCLQITKEIKQFASFKESINIVAVYGGKNMSSQIRELKNKPQILVATPGRLSDMISRKLADMSELSYLVLDEADIMLNMGFREELDFILGSTPKERQTLLFSATMPKEVERIASRYMTDPIEISVGKKNSGTDTIEHSCYVVHAKDRYNALKRLVDYNPCIYGLIFCRTRANTKLVADKMVKDGYNAEALHGDLTQDQRELVMKKFREKSLQMVIATDIAARGIDVNDLTHVINYELPDDIESYNHRSGRTGRAGKKGKAYSIVNLKEKHKIRRIENTLGQKITESAIPTGKEICEQQLMHLMDKIQTVDIDEKQIDPYLKIIKEKVNHLDRETLLKHFISLEFNRFLSYYGNAKDLQTVTKESKNEKRNNRNRSNSKNSHYTKMTLNAGDQDRLTPQQLISMINRCTKGSRVDIGRIDIQSTKTIVQVSSESVDLLTRNIVRVPFGEKQLKLTVATNAYSSSPQKDQSPQKRKRKPNYNQRNNNRKKS